MTQFRRIQYLMGTTIEIVAYAEERVAAHALELAFAEFERIERTFTLHDPGSELSQVNRAAAESPVSVSGQMFDVVERAIALCAQSDGAFSITLGALSALWKRCLELERFPSADEIRSANEQSDWRCVRLDPANRTIAFDRAGLRLDLGGFVKGYAVDRARDALVRGGVTRAMISAGESSLSVHEEPGDEGWRIGVRHPADETRLVGVLDLRSTCVSTSGTYERRSLLDGRTVSHLIDPTSGRAIEGLSGATAVCKSAEMAEVASKMLLLRGCRDALSICDQLRWDVEGLTVRSHARTSTVEVEQSEGLGLTVFSEELNSNDAVSTSP